MNQNNQDTEDILDAIKSMMSNDQIKNEQKLPKDIIELTKPIAKYKIKILIKCLANIFSLSNFCVLQPKVSATKLPAIAKINKNTPLTISSK